MNIAQYSHHTGRLDRHDLLLVNPAWLSPSTNMSSLGLEHCMARRTCSIVLFRSRLFSDWKNEAHPWEAKAGDGEKKGQDTSQQQPVTEERGSQ